MLSDQNIFKFDLNESLYFEKGQEVSEMVKISLDPKISIQPFNEYVSIRGVIELQGEYEKVIPENQDEYNSSNFEDYQSRRYLEKIEDTEDGKARFSHRFPVEITVPSYRVSNINDITVSIESFDYEIPNESQLKLISSIEIQGISELERPDELVTDEETEEEVIEENLFEFEIKKRDDIVEEETDHEIESRNPETVSELPHEEDVAEVELESKDDEPETNEKDRFKIKKVQTFEDFFKTESTTESAIVTTEENEEIIEPEESEVSDQKSLSEMSKDVQQPIEDINDSVESTEIEGVSYLSDMFRGNESAEYTKIRICIVQDKDTIENIADRYEITASQLMSRNHLEDQDLSEGQLLSIPDRE